MIIPGDIEIDQDMLLCLEQLNGRLKKLDVRDPVIALYCDRAMCELGCSDMPSEMHDVSDIESIGISDFISKFKIRPTSLRVFTLGSPKYKKAYPDPSSYLLNTGKASSSEKNASLFVSVGNLIRSGKNFRDAVRLTIKDLDRDSKIKFLQWLSIKTHQNTNLVYLAGEKMNKLTKQADFGAGEVLNSEFIYEFYKNKEKAEQAASLNEIQPNYVHDLESAAKDAETGESFKKMRDKMIGRTFAIDKLLEKNHDLLKPEQVEQIEDSLNTLRKNIRKLKMASLKDSIIKTANIAQKNGWLEGAALIDVLASDESKFIKTASAVGASSENLPPVLDSLQEIALMLRQRGIIRELAARDIDLFNLGYGHMTEVGDASAKLMEAFNSAANKIEDVVSRLKAEVQQQTQPKSAPKSVKTLVDPRDLPLAKELAPEPPTSIPAASGELPPVSDTIEAFKV